MDIQLFVLIVSLGLAIPFTGILIINLSLKLIAGDNYELNMLKLGKVYGVSLVSWALFVSILIKG
jgi:hypothetical protein